MKTKIATLLLLPFFFASCSEEEGYTVQRKKLVQAVYSSGEVLPAGYYEATSKIPGIVDTVYVRVGQEVKAGTPLLRLQSQAERLNVQTAKNLYALARENAAEDAELLSSLQQKVETAYEAYKWDSLDYERYKRLRAQDIGTQQTYEQAELRYQTAKRNYTIAQNNLQETRMRLQTELKNAKNNYLAQQSRLADHTIVAEADGKVYDILPKPGELVSSSTPIIYLGAADAFEVEMRVDETDIILVKAGQQVLYALDALEHTVFRGVVRKIFPTIHPADKTARVFASIDPLNYAFYQGMSLEANIIVQEKEDVLVIPVEYLAADGTVLLKKDGKVTTVEVRTGIRDLEYIEILSGLEAEDYLMKP